MAAVLLAGAGLAWMVWPGGDGQATPQPRATFVTPTGRNVALTVRKIGGGEDRWCARAVIGDGIGPGLHTSEDCGAGAAAGLHGGLTVDCINHELLLTIATRSGLAVRQRRRHKPDVIATRVDWPDGMHIAGSFYAIVVDLREPRPVLVATKDGQPALRHDFSAEARHCIDTGADQFGGF